MSDLFLDFFSKKEIPFNKVLNSVIEGDNLLSLQILSHYYLNKIKLIYIDPPYNTKKKFIYKDNFGSHQNWLEMMRPRLILARSLLKEDGFIFISIDDNELSYLKLLMDEIFGESNFRNCIIVPRGIKNVQAQFDYSNRIAVGHEYVLFYSKKKESKIKKFEVSKPEQIEGKWNNHWRGTDRPNLRYELLGLTPKIGQWRWSKQRSLQAINNYNSLIQEMLNKKINIENKIILQTEIDQWYSDKLSFGKKIDLLRMGKSGKPEHYVPKKNTRLGSDVWLDIGASGSHDLKKQIDNCHFDMPKPVALIKRMIELVTKYNSNDIVLDFFAGSGTTAQAVCELNSYDSGNRSFILMQTPDKIKFKNNEYSTISNLAYQRIKNFLKNQKMDIEVKYLIQSIPNEINSSSTGGGGAFLVSPKPSIIKSI
ncbi:site-specific DNA-methyltransferase [Silvanigrella aquatica]|uniref:site-specific DNA-methyltransferase n=1 Tax=Silvanigrella aquatica TaxID=1915309 RepID=UPI000AB2A8F1|nr:site-specific DNA-methyltransferase [Silvanigrella aquatica]